MSRSTQYLLMTLVVVGFVIAAFLVYSVTAGPSPDEATAAATPSPSTGLPVATAEPVPPEQAAPAAGFSPADIYRRSAAGVVLVQAAFGGESGPHAGLGEALGSGFVVDERGTILTNAHVVAQNGLDAEQVWVSFRNGQEGAGGRIEAEVVGVDQTTDIAVLRVDPEGRELTPLPLGDSSRVVIGQWVVAIGNPLGFDFSLTVGIVSGVGRDLQAPNGAIIPNGIQTDAAINQGNSGGPLIDGSGRVIGINEQIASSGGGNDGLGFAVPINTAIRSLEQIKTSGRVTYAWMGVSLQTLTPDIAGMFDMETQGGALVQAVSPESPAAKAGVRGGDQTVTVQGQEFIIGGDVIIKADDTEIRSADDLIAFLGTKKPGDTIGVTVERDGRTQDLKVTLAERPSDL